MMDEMTRFKRFAKWVLISPVISLAVLYVVNVVTHQRLVMLATGTGLFSWVSGVRNSPTGKYVVAVQSSGMQGVTHSVKVARKFSVWPTEIMTTASEDFSGKGPEGKNLALVWGMRDQCIGLLFQGWLVDFYDFRTHRADSWSKGLYIGTDLKALARYHQRIEERLGTDRQVQVIRE
jgi:hypothetical protein